MLLEELKAAEAAEKAASEKEKKLKEEDGGEEAPTEDQEKEKETNKGSGRDRGDKDWRRTGRFSSRFARPTLIFLKTSVGLSGSILRLHS
jgi:septal ring factor EnvC (AmiA/AmiB activator)